MLPHSFFNHVVNFNVQGNTFSSGLFNHPHTYLIKLNHLAALTGPTKFVDNQFEPECNVFILIFFGCYEHDFGSIDKFDFR